METPVHKRRKHVHFHRSINYRVSLSSVIFKNRFGISLAAGLGILLAAAATQVRDFVAFSQPYPSGRIKKKQSERKLFFTTGPGPAVRYPIAIGRAGKAWL